MDADLVVTDGAVCIYATREPVNDPSELARPKEQEEEKTARPESAIYAQGETAKLTRDWAIGTATTREGGVKTGAFEITPKEDFTLRVYGLGSQTSDPAGGTASTTMQVKAGQTYRFLTIEDNAYTISTGM